MESREAFEKVEEVARTALGQEREVRRAALVVSVLAAVLALSTLGGNAGATEALLAQTKASDAWNEFQANSLKRHVNENDAALLRLIARGTSAERDAFARADELERSVREKYRPNQDALQSKATHLEEERDGAERQHRGFQLAEAALQLAIVLASVSIVARAPLLFAGAGVLGVTGALVALAAALRLLPL